MGSFHRSQWAQRFCKMENTENTQYLLLRESSVIIEWHTDIFSVK
jgi:hypothetical protein